MLVQHVWIEDKAEGNKRFCPGCKQVLAVRSFCSHQEQLFKSYERRTELQIKHLASDTHTHTCARVLSQPVSHSCSNQASSCTSSFGSGLPGPLLPPHLICPFTTMSAITDLKMCIIPGIFERGVAIFRSPPGQANCLEWSVFTHLKLHWDSMISEEKQELTQM